MNVFISFKVHNKEKSSWIKIIILINVSNEDKVIKFYARPNGQKSLYASELFSAKEYAAVVATFSNFF